MIEKFRDALSRVPEKPGVYIMHDANDTVLYVGKAIVLRNRLRSYFMDIPHSDRITVMISQIDRFEYMVCSTEYEALLLENNLIKKYKPKYNVLLKDDKGFPYIKVTVNEDFPRVMLARKTEKDGARYFGPFFSTWTVNKTLESLKSILPLRQCKKKINIKQSDRPCLNYHMGLCRAPCAGNISAEDYGKIVSAVISFLEGHQEYVQEMLKEQMTQAASKQEFELACIYRDRLKALEKMREKQKISMVSEGDFDVVATEKNQVDACTQVFFVRGGKVLGREFYMFDGAADEEETVITESFIKQFYNENQYIPPKIYIGCNLEETEVLEENLSRMRGFSCHIVTPVKGDKKKLCDMVRENAAIALKNREENALTEGITEKKLAALRTVQEIFGLEKLPMRTESYDISNQGDSEINASMVVFYGGNPVKKDYRLFKMKTVKERSDTDSMVETLRRRIKRYLDKSQGFETLPDIFLIDGGLGQINAALSVLHENGLNIPVLGMVKDNHHHSRGLMGPKPSSSAFPGKISLSREDIIEFDLKNDTDVWHLITTIQNETHRVAVSYNRKLTEKRYKKSELDSIKGLGPKGRIALLQKFGSVSAIKEASAEQLAETPGIGKSRAEIIYEAIRKKE